MLDTGFVEQRTVGNQSISAGLVAMLGGMSSVTKEGQIRHVFKGKIRFQLLKITLCNIFKDGLA